jgi:hypothetical protein
MHLVKKLALVFVASGVLAGTLAGCGEKKDGGEAPKTPEKPAMPEAPKPK